jgi:Holliday junction DNA helicase RuvA
MIDFLRGQLAHRETEYVVLDVNGVGYRVFCPNPYAVGANGDAAPVTMFIHHHVREDAILLFGFLSREEQALFRKLLDVSGIGPKVALGILSAGRPEAVISAIYQENIVFLTRLPGIGKKTAQRIILDMKDKLADLPVGGLIPVAAAFATESEMAEGQGGGAWKEAKMALVALGYSETEIDRVWPAVRDKATGLEKPDTFVKLALQALFRG